WRRRPDVAATCFTSCRVAGKLEGVLSATATENECLNADENGFRSSGIRNSFVIDHTTDCPLWSDETSARSKKYESKKIQIAAAFRNPRHDSCKLEFQDIVKKDRACV